jgi:hypothetical protein
MKTVTIAVEWLVMVDVSLLVQVLKLPRPALVKRIKLQIPYNNSVPTSTTDSASDNVPCKTSLNCLNVNILLRASSTEDAIVAPDASVSHVHRHSAFCYL